MALFDQKKLQLSQAPTVLGVTYNLTKLQLEIKEERKKELVEEIDAIVSSGLLDPGSAGKLKGKLIVWCFAVVGKDRACVLATHLGAPILEVPSFSRVQLGSPARGIADTVA